jgi:hypothetical protein
MGSFKLGEKVLVTSVLRRGYDFDRLPRNMHRKVWRTRPAKRHHGIIVGKRTLADVLVDLTEPHRFATICQYSAYLVAFNLSARHEYVLGEHLLPDTEENAWVLERFLATRVALEAARDDVVDAEIVEDPDVPF